MMHPEISSRPPTIPEQGRIAWRIAFAISLAAVRGRLSRSLIAMFGVVLAIAFLSYMLATQGILKALMALDDDRLNVRLQEAGVDIFRGTAADPMLLLLLGLTLLTCTVGIANAMLMAVTERVREIGTLKCLGARDEFIMKTYMIESTSLGVLGATLGTIVGLLAAVAVSWLNYGAIAVTALSPGTVVAILAASLLMGAVMSAAAALIPACMAARKQPVEALRAEE